MLKKVKSCWVLEYKGFDVLGDNEAIFITFSKRNTAMTFFFEVINKLQRQFPSLSWRADTEKEKDPKKIYYSITAMTNPTIYVRCYKSIHYEDPSFDVTKLPFIK